MYRDTRKRVQQLSLTALLLCGAASGAMAEGGSAAALVAEDPLAPLAIEEQVAQVEEVRVTARRRDENAQDVPIALSVIGGETLAASGAVTLGQIQQLAPSLQVFSTNPRNTNVNIRGLGSNVAFSNDGLENGVGVYIDGVFYGRLGQSQFDLVDLQQVEILRGPQGTLFGKNTTAGAINITSRTPSFTPEASVEATLGNYGYAQVKGSMSGPLGEQAAFRLSLANTTRDGFMENVATGEELQDHQNFSIRGQLLVLPNDNLKIRLIGDYSRQEQVCCVGSVVGAFDRYDSGALIPNNLFDRFQRAGYTPLPFDPFARKTDIDAAVQANMSGYGVSAQVDWDIGNHTLTSITAARGWDWDPANDNDYLGLPILVTGQVSNRQQQFSQEFRLASRAEGRFDYVLGAYYFWQIIDGYGRTGFGPATASWNLPTVPAVLGNAALDGFEYNLRSDPETTSYAAFGQGTWRVTDRLKVTGGLRYTFENKRGSFRQSHEKGADLSSLSPALAATALALRAQFGPTADYAVEFDDDAISGLLTASYAATEDSLIYASYSRGAKSGGLNLSVLPTGASPRVAPEGVEAYEVGLKSQWFDRTLTANLAAFQTNITDYQTAIIEIRQDSVAALQYIANIPEVRSRGVEGDLIWRPSRLFSLNGSFAYTDAAYVEYQNALQAPENLDLGPRQDLSGQRLPGVSRFSYTLGADVAWPAGVIAGRPVEVYGHADWSHRSAYFTSSSNSRYTEVPAYGLANLRIGVRAEDGLWDLSAWARNLGDENYFQTLSNNNYGLITGILGDPRTFGLTLRSRF